MEYDPLPDRTKSQAQETPSQEAGLNPYRQPEPPSTEKSGRRRQIVRWLVIPLVTALLAVAAGVVVGAMIQRPEVDGLHDFQHRLVTQVFDSRGEVFRKYQRENRILIEANQMPKDMVLNQAIRAAEDNNFYKHGGIDIKGVLRATYRNMLAGRRKEGASTLTMQVARQVFLHRRREWTRKIEEAFLAVELEKKYSKDQILTLWANLQNLGHGNYGMEAAAREYFNKSVGDLTITEAATLAGIPNRPSTYAMRTKPDRVKERRDYVLWRMRELNFITVEEHDAAVAEPVLAVPRRRERKLGSYFAEDVRREIYKTYGEAALYDRGLQVQTTLDSRIQAAAEDAVREGLLSLDHMKGWRGAREHLEGEDLADRELPSWIGQPPGTDPWEWHEGIVLETGRKTAKVKIEGEIYELGVAGIKWTGRKRPDKLFKVGDVSWFRFEAPTPGKEGEEGEEPVLMVEQEPELQSAALVLESATGAIRAMVGGWDYESNEFNRATQARRQVGSAFKAFVYGAALENGYTAADTLFDGPAVFLGANNEPSYSPRNHSRQYYGVTTLRKALQSSYNVTAVKMLDVVGMEPVINFARRCGIQSEMPPYPSLALGAADLIPLELAAAYAAIVNRGIYVKPYFIERVLTRSGRLLQEHMTQAHQAMDPRHAYVLTKMLQGVATAPHGTGASGLWGLRNMPLDVAGKTGTTSAYTDAWFVGFTPRYTILSWVGYDQNRSIGRGMTGFDAALPIWTRVLKRGLEEGWIAEGETFQRPPGIVERQIQYDTGLLVDKGYTETFVEGNEPDVWFDEHWASIIEYPWYLQEPYYLPKGGEKMPSDISDWTTVRETWREKNKRHDQPN